MVFAVDVDGAGGEGGAFCALRVALLEFVEVVFGAEGGYETHLTVLGLCVGGVCVWGLRD